MVSGTVDDEVSGHLSCIDPESQKEIWTLEPKKFKNVSRLIKPDDLIYVQEGMMLMKNTLFDIKSGKIVYNIKNEPVFGIFPELDIVLSVSLNDSVYCRNLSNGSVRWSFILEHAERGWNDLVKIDDSTLVLSVSGLHFVNITNGRIAYNPTSTNGDMRKVAQFSSQNTGSEQLIFYNYAFPNGLFSSDQIWGLASNVIYDNKFVYSAGHSDVTCFDHKGKKIWNAVTDSMASGRLIFSDSLLVYINKGYSILPGTVTRYYGSSVYKEYVDYKGSKILYGLPCIKIYNRSSGREILKSESLREE